MEFTPKQHLEIDNYIKYIDKILHMCDKGIEYCKICPNEFVCTELEKDDFGLNNSMYRKFKVAVVTRTLVRIGCKRTEVHTTLKKSLPQAA